MLVADAHLKTQARKQARDEKNENNVDGAVEGAVPSRDAYEGVGVGDGEVEGNASNEDGGG